MQKKKTKIKKADSELFKSLVKNAGFWIPMLGFHPTWLTLFHSFYVTPQLSLVSALLLLQGHCGVSITLPFILFMLSWWVSVMGLGCNLQDWLPPRWQIAQLVGKIFFPSCVEVEPNMCSDLFNRPAVCRFVSSLWHLCNYIHSNCSFSYPGP